ncbi:phage head closure protein [Pseudomonas sp.]|uniref:phage head closure protein n=1 Tax=Pseudomonas sp. TaxID=306 RepID=UPI0025903A31|nr:phage head closure protein [Pseudomonas sp.]
MKLGRMRHLIEIQRRALVQDPATGEMVDGAWVKFAKVYSAIEPLSTREFVEAQANQSEFTARIVIRYRPGVQDTMRVLHGGMVYAIKGPPLADKESGREYLALMVAAGVSDG